MRRLFVLAFLLAALDFPALAAVSGSCLVNASASPTLRSNGRAELVGDLVLTCTGSGTTDVFVAMNAPVSSRAFDSGSPPAAEALLLVNEPGSGLTGTVSAQVACDAVSARSGSCPAGANVIQGEIVGVNQLAFRNVPVAPMSGLAVGVLRIANLRIDASTVPLVGVAPVMGAVSAAAFSISGNPAPVVGFVQNPTTVQLLKPDLSGPVPSGGIGVNGCTPLNQPLASNPASPNAPDGVSFVVRIQENFATVFKTMVAFASPAPDGNSRPLAAPQDVPGWIYNTESGFYNPAFPTTGGPGVVGFPTSGGLSVAGLATQATRFLIRFQGLAGPMQVHAPVYERGKGAADSRVRLVSAGSDGNGWPDYGPLGPLSALNTYYSPGMIYVYEVTGIAAGVNANAVDSIDLPFYLAYAGPGTVPAGGQTTVNVTLAPTTGDGTPGWGIVPRFADVSLPLPVVNLTACAILPSNVTLTVAPNPVVTGQSVTLTATVTAGATGTVTFSSNGAQIGAPAPLTANQCQITILAGAGPGTQPFTAVYSGDGNFQGSSGTTGLVINKGGSVTQLTSPSDSQISVFGQAFTLSASVAPLPPAGGFAPTGEIQFFSDGIVIATGALSVTGGPTATVSLGPNYLAAGSHSLTAVYQGNSMFLGSTSSPAISFTVDKHPATVSTPVLVSGTPTFGETLTFSATVGPRPTGRPGGPFGSISFNDGSNAIGSGTVNADGTASVAIASLAPGAHSVTATYGGDANYLASNPSGALALTINKRSANIAITSSTVTSLPTGQNIVYGQPVSLSISLTGITSTPPGGSLSLVDNGATTLCTATVTSGAGACTVAASSLAVGAHAISAANYGGDGNYILGTVTPLSFTVVKANTSVLLSASPTHAPTNLTATITVNAPGSGSPTGSVQFFNGGTAIGSAPVVQGAGPTFIATLSTPASGSLTATYSGDANFNSSTSAAIPVAAPLPTTLTLTSSSNPSTLLQKVTFTASVASANENPTGAVQFFDGATFLGTVTLTGGQASFSTTGLAPGSHAISARYDGTAGPASASMGQVVYKLPTSVSLSAAPLGAAFGQAVTLTAQVGPVPPAGFAAPSGQIEFRDAGFAMGTAALNSGVATLTASNLHAGTHPITALYSEDATWAAGHSTPVTVTITPAGSITTLTPSIGPSGQVVLTASVTAAPAGLETPMGPVQFIDTTNGAIVATAALAGGTAAATISASRAITSAGTQPLAAVYSGNSDIGGSTSAPMFRLSNAAAYNSAAIAPDEIVNVFLSGLVNADAAVSSLPLPYTLGGASVKVTDSSGAARYAPLYGVFASTGQINFLIPADTARGLAVVTVTGAAGTSLSTVVNVTPTAAGVFSANASGTGVAAAHVLRVCEDGSRTLETAATWDSQSNAWVAAPINMGPETDRLFLTLYGTGIRHRSAESGVTATVNGVSVLVQYSGAQSGYSGLDQINLELPRSLSGCGSAKVAVTVDDQPANTLSITFQ